MSSISINPRTGQRSLPLPAEEVLPFLPDPVKAAIADAAAAGVKVTEVTVVLRGEDNALSEARRLDLQARADAVQSGRSDPGEGHVEAVRKRLDEARRRPPVLEELQSRAVLNIQRAAQACGEPALQVLADLTYAKRREFVKATEAAQEAKLSEMRCQAALGWLVAVTSDEPIHKQGRLLAIGDTIAIFDALRTRLTIERPRVALLQLGVEKGPGEG